VVKEALKNIKFVEFPDKNEFRNYYKRLEESGYLKKNVKDLGYADEDEFFRNFLYDEIYQYVVSRLENDPSWMPEKANATVRMGYLTADLHQLAFYVALKEGYFEKVGIKIEKKEYANGVYEMEGFKAGEIDVGYLGGAPATLKRVNEDIEIKIIAGANNEGSAIVARDVDSLKDLTGKKVAIPGFGTVQDFLLRMAAEKEGTELEIG
jgi:NitT/TauT family transport system substrate-binding protein